MSDVARLPRNFHKSFKPERQYLAAMLRYAAAGGAGTFQEIAASTGIPMGTSSGKVPAILDYCRGMGLARLSDDSLRSSTKQPILTSFGRAVLQEDPYLKCAMTQWLAHLNLCSPLTGADVWFQTFVGASASLGTQFPRKRLEEHLSGVYGVSKQNIIGPMVGMYNDDAAFKACGAITETSGELTKHAAPYLDEFGLGLGAWVLQLIEDFFPDSDQVSVTELDRKAGWRTIPGWKASDAQAALDLLSRKGCLTVDRHMDPWLIQPQMRADRAWQEIFEDMI